MFILIVCRICGFGEMWIRLRWGRYGWRKVFELLFWGWSLGFDIVVLVVVNVVIKVLLWVIDVVCMWYLVEI